MTGQVIDFQGELDDEGGAILLRAAHIPDVFVQLIEAHAPIIKVIAAHRGMVGKTDFCQTDFEGAGRVLGRLPAGMTAERGVHVIIGGPRHASTFGWPRWNVEYK